MNVGDGKYNKPRKHNMALVFYDNPSLPKHHDVPEKG